MAQSSGFLLGVDYTTSFSLTYVDQMVTDGSGAVYFLSICSSADNSPSCVTKLSPDGKTTLWQNNLGFNASAIAVDQGGRVYVIPGPLSGSSFVEKLSTDGTSVVWNTAIGPDDTVGALALDSAGDLYVAGPDPYFEPNDGGFITRLSATGAIDFTASLPFPVLGMVIDGLGRPFVAGLSNGAPHVERLEPDGSESSWAVSINQAGTEPPAIAADQSGNLWIYAGSIVDQMEWLHFDAQGNQTFEDSARTAARHVIAAGG